jgi:ABC-2 type transport system permease protein
MKKFKFLVKYGLKKRVWRKAFLISNIIIALLMIIIINIPSIISLFGGGEDPDEQIFINLINETSQTVLLSDYSDLMNEPFSGAEYFVFTPIALSEFDVDGFWGSLFSGIRGVWVFVSELVDIIGYLSGFFSYLYPHLCPEYSKIP